MGDYRTKPIRIEAVEWNEDILKLTAYKPARAVLVFGCD